MQLASLQTAFHTLDEEIKMTSRRAAWQMSEIVAALASANQLRLINRLL